VLALALMRRSGNAGRTMSQWCMRWIYHAACLPSFLYSALAWNRQCRSRRQAGAGAANLAFADRPVLLEKLEQVRNLAVTEGGPRGDAIDQAATNLERALDEALLGLDRDRVQRLVLFTDGNQTQGDVWRVLARLKEANVPGVSDPGESARMTATPGWKASTCPKAYAQANR